MGLRTAPMNYIANPLPILTNLTALLDLKLTKLMTFPREDKLFEYVASMFCVLCVMHVQFLKFYILYMYYLQLPIR